MKVLFRLQVPLISQSRFEQGHRAPYDALKVTKTGIQATAAWLHGFASFNLSPEHGAKGYRKCPYLWKREASIQTIVVQRRTCYYSFIRCHITGPNPNPQSIACLFKRRKRNGIKYADAQNLHYTVCEAYIRGLPHLPCVCRSLHNLGHVIRSTLPMK